MKPQIQLINLQTLASGDKLELKIYKFLGKNKGKKTYIQANLHGAEIVGNIVIYELINFLSGLSDEQLEGEIWLVPVCNPTGVNQRYSFFSTGRYNPYDGYNWNRIFWDYLDEKPDLDSFVFENINEKKNIIEQKYFNLIKTNFQVKLSKINPNRSISFSEHYRNTLQSLSLNSHYVIDIHSASILAIDYLYCFCSREASADYFLFDYAILMNKYDGYAFDEAFLNPWLVLEKKFAQQGRNIRFEVESWTLELGAGMVANPESVNQGISGIKNYLVAKNMLKLNREAQRKQTKFIPKNKIKSYYAPQGGIIRHRLPLNTRVNQGDILYQILSFNKQEELPTIMEIKSADQGVIFDVSTNETVSQGEYVLGIFPHV
jgi:predicted deacylase